MSRDRKSRPVVVRRPGPGADGSGPGPDMETAINTASLLAWAMTPDASKVFDRDWLRARIAACGRSVPKVAAAAGLGSSQTIYDHLSGKRSMSADNLCRVIQATARHA